MATSDKLNKLLETKAAIRNAIIDKGVDVGEDVVFADYPAKISAIQSGGNGPDYTAVYLAQTSNGTTYKELFKNSTLTEINLDNYDTSNVTDMYGVFYSCSNLTSLDLSDFDTSSVEDMNCMFYKCENLTTLDLSNFDTSNVTDMNAMFRYCSNLTTLDLSNFNTSNVTNINNMFYGCTNLTTLNVSNWDTSNVTSAEGLFNSCSSLASLDVSNFDTSNVTDMGSMFSNCQKLITIGNLSNWNTSQVTDMGSMFSNCYALEELDIRNFDMTNVKSTTYMFFACRNLHTLRLDNCSKDTISKIINSSSFAPSSYSATRKIYVNPDNIGDLVAPTKCVFINCLTEEEIVQE